MTPTRRRALALSALFALAALSTRAAEPAPLTLEAILAAPFPSELTAAPAGGALAWIVDLSGVRNVWVAEPPDYRGRRLTSYTEDDGVELESLEWSPDGRTLLYVRGSGANRAGQNANPTSDPAGAAQELWRVALAGGAPVKIAAGSGAAVSPAGDGVAYRTKGKLWWAPFDGAAEPKAILEARGGLSSLRFSPDGKRLAFVSARGDHAFVGVLDVAAERVRWMAPSVDTDSDPVWSPDGSRLAFLRQSADLDYLYFRAHRAGEPWSILVADPETGEARTVFTAKDGSGSVFTEMTAANQILWGAGDRLVFPWERSGWRQLYSVPAVGGQPALLSTGSPATFEIENVVLAPDRRTVVYNSNQGDPERRHLWRVRVEGGTPERLTDGDEVAWLPAVVQQDGRERLAFLRAGPRRPAEAVLREGEGVRALAPEAMPAGYPADRLVAPEAVELVAQDGVRVRGQLFLPQGAARGRRPGLLFFHGGPPRQMLLGWHYMGYYYRTYAMNQYLANRGYVVLSVNFRCGIGYGMEFREALDQGADGASEFQDVLAAAAYLRQRADVDPERVGLWGGSYGGYLTALGLARASHLFRAGVDLHGVHDWNEGLLPFFPDYEKLERPELARRAFESSPLHFVDGWRSPVLLIHGDDDRNVAFAQTVRLVQELRKRKVEVEQLVLPDEVHSFLTWQGWLAAFRATADFFERRLARP